MTKHLLEDDIPDRGLERPVITAVQCRLYILCLSLLWFDHTSPEIQTVGERGKSQHVHHSIISYQTWWLTRQRRNLPQSLVRRRPSSLTGLGRQGGRHTARCHLIKREGKPKPPGSVPEVRKHRSIALLKRIFYINLYEYSLFDFQHSPGQPEVTTQQQPWSQKRLTRLIRDTSAGQVKQGLGFCLLRQQPPRSREPGFDLWWTRCWAVNGRSSTTQLQH